MKEKEQKETAESLFYLGKAIARYLELKEKKKKVKKPDSKLN